MKRFLYFMALACCLGFAGCDDDSSDPSENENGTETGTENNTENPEVPSESEKDACNNECDENQVCDNGVCNPICENGEELCDGNCLDFVELHLEDCNTCSSGYCDSNDDFSDGCDIDAMADDVNNCGSCGNQCEDDEKCNSGICENICTEEDAFCNGECRNLDELHLASCDACAENYCDANADMSDGCEVSIMDDAANCGACGNACNEGDLCAEGSCYTPYKAHRVMIMKAVDVVDDPTNKSKLGSLAVYQYAKVIDEADGWFKIEYNGSEAWINGTNTMDVCEECEGRKAVDYAEKFLYTTENKMCTYDFLVSGEIENFTKISTCCGYGNNCVNFVSAVLETVGMLSKHQINVGGINNYCAAGNEGYRRITDKSEVKPGDIWLCGGDHAEMVVGYYKGDIVLIASNNFNGELGRKTDNCQTTCSGQAGTAYQRVSYNKSSWCDQTQYIYSKQQ